MKEGVSNYKGCDQSTYSSYINLSRERNYTDPLTVNIPVFVYIKQQNYSLLKGTILLPVVPAVLQIFLCASYRAQPTCQWRA